MLVTKDQLVAIGEMLAKIKPEKYGRGWQTALARELGVTDRAMRYYVAGERNIPEPTARLIQRIAADAMA